MFVWEDAVVRGSEERVCACVCAESVRARQELLGRIKQLQGATKEAEKQKQVSPPPSLAHILHAMPHFSLPLAALRRP